MSTIGFTCPPIPGHLNPMLALAKELQRRGHRVVVLSIADAADTAARHGVEFAALAPTQYPPGVSQAQITRISQLGQLASFRLTMQLCLEYTQMQFRELPATIRALGIDALVVDEACWAGASVAQHLDIPYVSVANALPFCRETSMPPAYTGWQPRGSSVHRLRNWLCFQLENFAVRKVSQFVDQQRKSWGLSGFDIDVGVFSRLAHLSQCPESFDFPRHGLPPTWHGVGPMRGPEASNHPFPFERLDGRPLIYASLGSLQGARREVFATLAEACAPLDVQLVITHGYGLKDDETRGFAGDPLVVAYAPQAAVLERASMVITHAGMNTVLDTMSAGLPALAIPLAYEQPSIAARVAWHGAGEALSPKQLSAAAVRAAVTRLLSDPRYRSAARRVASGIAAGGGVARAAQVAERAFSSRQPVIAASFRDEQPITQGAAALA